MCEAVETFFGKSVKIGQKCMTHVVGSIASRIKFVLLPV